MGVTNLESAEVRQAVELLLQLLIIVQGVLLDVVLEHRLHHRSGKRPTAKRMSGTKREAKVGRGERKRGEV